MNQPAKIARGKPEDARSDVIQAEDLQLLDEMHAAHLIKSLYDTVTFRPFGTADKRLKQMDLSLGAWMLKFSGIIPHAVSGPNQFTKHYIYIVSTLRQPTLALSI